MNVFSFVEAEGAERRNVAKACELLEVSRSAFYNWHQHLPPPRHLADEELAERIEAIHNASRGTYGWPRVQAQLRRDGHHVSGSGCPGSCARRG